MNARAARVRAEKILRCSVADLRNKSGREHEKSVIAGIACEMPRTRPSLSELASACGVEQGTARAWLTSWYRLEWRERYAWCRLAEGLKKGK